MDSARERLEAIMLSQCINAFERLRHRAAVEHGDDYGCFPCRAIVTFREHTIYPAKGRSVRRWQVTDGQAVPVSPDYGEGEESAVSGMYYDTARYSFSFSDDLSEAHTHMILGPRFGRGFSYEVVEEKGEFLFRKEKIVWVS